MDKRFFGFLPQEYLGFSNFQVQANNAFSLRKDKNKALPLGAFWLIKRTMGVF
jgi:ABC-type sulfate/molybdate transport systems ATPase subunit